MSGTNFFEAKTSTVKVALTDASGNAVLAYGSTAPTSLAGYAIGCLFVLTSNGANYTNTGTAASATWTLAGTVTAGSVGATELASAVTPSHVVKYAGNATMVNANAVKAVTVSGVLSTDIVIATIKVNGGGTVRYIESVIPTTDTITITWNDTATTSDVTSYVVYRAIA